MSIYRKLRRYASSRDPSDLFCGVCAVFCAACSAENARCPVLGRRAFVRGCRLDSFRIGNCTEHLSASRWRATAPSNRFVPVLAGNFGAGNGICVGWRAAGSRFFASIVALDAAKLAHITANRAISALLRGNAGRIRAQRIQSLDENLDRRLHIRHECVLECVGGRSGRSG